MRRCIRCRPTATAIRASERERSATNLLFIMNRACGATFVCDANLGAGGSVAEIKQRQQRGQIGSA